MVTTKFMVLEISTYRDVHENVFCSSVKHFFPLQYQGNVSEGNKTLRMRNYSQGT